MPSLNTGIQRVKKALATSSAIQWMTHYLVKDGYVYATDSRLMARAPVNVPFTLMAPAKELERAIREDSTFVLDNERALLIKTGRTKIKMAVILDDAEYPAVSGFPGPQEGLAVDAEFIRVLLKAMKYVSKDASPNHVWAMGASVEGDKITATNFRIGAQFTLPAAAPMSMLFPQWLLEFLSTCATMPNRIAAPTVANGTTPFIYLLWDDGTSVRGQTLASEFSPQINSMIAEMPSPDWEVTADWRAAFSEIVSVVQGEMTIGPSKIIVEGPNSTTAEIEIETPVTADRKWTTDELSQMLAEATHINFEYDTRRSRESASWRGLTGKGLLAGRA